MTIFHHVGTLCTYTSHTLSFCGVQLLNSNVPGKGQGSFVHSRHVLDPVTLEYVPVPQSAQTVDEVAENFPASQLMQNEEAAKWRLPRGVPVVRAQSQTTSHQHMHMYTCIDVCVCTHIYVCMYVSYVECRHACTHTHTMIMIMIMMMTTTLAHHHNISFGVCIIIM